VESIRPIRAAPRPNVEPPRIAAPPPLGERRASFRRAADRAAHEEAVLLARALDVLATGRSAESRLAGLLGLLSRTVGARRAAVLSGATERRTAAAAGPSEDPEGAEALAAWLDVASLRSRAERAAAGPAHVDVVRAELPLDRRATLATEPHYALLPIGSAGDVVLGFEFADPDAAATFADRLPANLTRHAAVALALVSDQLATERELAILRARDAERTRFVSTVAHELRTPLTGLSGYLDLVTGGRVDDPAIERDFLDRSRQIVDSMDELVGDLLELARLESGTLRLEVAPFSVAEVGGRVLDSLEPIALERGIGLRATLPPRLRVAAGDRRRTEQILTNLVGNALKFTPAGSDVELAAWFDGPVAVFAVRDEGRGIAPEDRTRIFERFYRMAGHERVTGTGLGLPIARELARAMGGDLDVASVPGSGSSFLLVLPGPAGADADVVAAAIDRGIATEEIGLEERAVIRALQAAGRPLPTRRPSAEGAGDPMAPEIVSVGEEPDRALRRPALRALEGRGVAGGVRLRAIDGTRPMHPGRAPA
jgi:signal transduction histidine kinase